MKSRSKSIRKRERRLLAQREATRRRLAANKTSGFCGRLLREGIAQRVTGCDRQLAELREDPAAVFEELKPAEVRRRAFLAQVEGE